MREKLALAKILRNSRKIFSNNMEHKKLCSKCYCTYVEECIIKGKDEFKVVLVANIFRALLKEYLIGIIMY